MAEIQILVDKWGQRIRLTPERLAHIQEHPEMVGLEEKVAETLAKPERVVQSLSDESVHLYFRGVMGTRVGDKYLCVVVKFRDPDSFVLTAYLTDQIRKEVTLWPSVR